MGIENIKGPPKSDKKSDKAYKNKTLKSLRDKKVGDLSESNDDIPERMSREADMSPLKSKEFKSGGRVNLRGGGMCKRGMNKKAYGRNS